MIEPRCGRARIAASGALKPPDYTVLGEWPLTGNDETATRKVAAAFEGRFGAERVVEIASPISASEDFNLFGAAWGAPTAFWAVVGVDPEIYAKAEKAGNLLELPVNHASEFFPAIHPTLRVGIDPMLAATNVWLATQNP